MHSTVWTAHAPLFLPHAAAVPTNGRSISTHSKAATRANLISGYAVLPDGKNRPFHIETEQQGDGYAAMTAALEQGLKQAAQQMVE